MPAYQATADFISCLSEVEFLLSKAASYQSRPNEYRALVKASLLLLASKFESFVEEIVEEHAYKISSKHLRAIHLSEAIRMHSTIAILPHNLIEQIRNSKQDAIEKLQRAAALWDDAKSIDELVVDCSFNYGKHGSGEIEKIFARIGLENIFEVCEVKEASPSFDGAAEDEDALITIDVKADINALTHIRNSILHNDESPNVTHQQIDTYMQRLLLLSSEIDGKLGELMTALTENVVAAAVGGTA